MHTNSLPPSDRDEILACNEPLRSEAEAFRLSLPLSQADMSRELGISPSALSKWLNKKPEGDIVSLESLVADWLKSRPAREKLKLALFPTAVSRRLASHLEHVRRTNGVAIITGNAGLGKTCAAKIYFAENPTSVLLTAAAYRGNAAALAEHYKAKAVHFAPVLAEARRLAAPLTQAASDNQDHNAALFAAQKAAQTDYAALAEAALLRNTGVKNE
jgi:DNA transposition AAA+ family ATPase